MSDWRNSWAVIMATWCECVSGIARSAFRDDEEALPLMRLTNTEPKAGPHPYAAPACGPWRWAEAGRVIVWEEGQTVAFVEELEAIVERFGPRPSPVLPVLVYILAACRGMFVDSHPSIRTARGEIKGQLEQAGRALRKLAALPVSLQTTVARAEIVQMLCEDLHPRFLSPRMGENWKSWRNGGATNEPQPPAFYPSFYLGYMRAGLEAFSEEKLRARLNMGVEEVPEPAPLPEAEPEEKASAPLSDLLKDLAGDQELGGLAEIVRRIMAALVMPRKLSLRDDLPTGGVSDVANRGSPERLLITEIAQDPDIMAVRMVMGESLYLRREPPAVRRDPPPLVLVDFSLRLWGLPRMFAAATALAILASRNSDCPSQAWRIEKRMPRCLPLTRKEEVAEFLSHLEPDLDPLPGLQAWVQSLQDEPGDSERCFITHASQLRQGAFRNALRTMPRLLIATV
ncbi:MAG TPA: hypothetical protein VHM91_02170, partial [Verrucomicrobiales bacterium]|nr:hypothetical protein [Verrucomicrobiales bacterium]